MQPSRPGVQSLWPEASARQLVLTRRHGGMNCAVMTAGERSRQAAAVVCGSTGVSHPDTIADEMRCLLRHLGWILRGTHRRPFSGMKRFLSPREGGSLQDPPGEQLAICRVLQPNLTRHDAVTLLSPATVANYLSAEGPKNARGERTKAVLSHLTALGSLEGVCI